MSFEIVTDSSSNLPEDYIEKNELHILPLTFMIDGEEHHSYLKGEHTDLQQFYTLMREGKVITTSLPHLDESKALFRELLDAGKDVVYLGFSSGLSGTYEAIEIILNGLKEEYPDRKIVSIDTFAASGGQGLIVYHALKKSQNGASFDEIVQWVYDNRLKAAHWFTVDDLMFLFRGGRVSRTSAWAGMMLNIKPILHVDDEGHLIPQEKVRGRKKSLNALVDHMRASALDPASQTVFINHGDCIEDARYVANKIQEELGVNDFIINYIDPVIGAHAGPGTLAIFYLADSRN